MTDNPSTLIGVVLDLSGSMEYINDDIVEQKPGEWIDSVIRVIDDLITHDVSDSNTVFSIGVGGKVRKKIFDVLRTLEQFQISSKLSLHDRIVRILQILENAGAKYIWKWANIGLLTQIASNDMANLILRQLESNNEFVKMCVNNFLPEVCIKGGAYAASGHKLEKFTNFTQTDRLADSVVSVFCPATKDEIRKVFETVKRYLLGSKDYILKDINAESSFFDVKFAHSIIRGLSDGNELTETRRKTMLKILERCIFGGTHMYEALNATMELFGNNNYASHKKLLFILSDGFPTDSGNTDELLLKLQAEDVWVVSCYFTDSGSVEPKRLYSRVGENWNGGAQFLFNLSSKIPTQLLPRTIFIKHGWQIDIENNETRLFLQVNHPDHIKDACNLARNVVCCQDVLADLLSSVSLDLYINQYNGNFPAHEQEGGTCYANAAAAVLHLSMKRVLGRTNGYPEFNDLRQQLIKSYGENGASTFSVLNDVCGGHRLHCQNVKIIDALCAITAKRPVVATFYLTKNEWNAFSEFYTKNNTGILSRQVIDIRKRKPNENPIGHAVVLTSFNSECLRFMNSWGTNWGDVGFFRVQNAEVLDFQFMDVYWTLEDLDEEEKTYYAKNGSTVAAEVINKLKGLRAAKFKCELCHQESLVTEFTGTLLKAKCPICGQNFKCDNAGNILALNMYLTSLSR